MDIKVNKDSKLVKVLAAQARNERIDSSVAEEAQNIVSELVSDMCPQNRHEIAQTIGFAVNELQQHDLDFLNQIADIKNVAYGDKAAFRTRTGTIKAYYQAKGSTTPRSYVADKQIVVDTDEISARPAINVVDLRTGRVNIADLIREANREITNMKIMKVEDVLQAAIDDYSTPFYVSGTASQGVVKASFDPQINYFRRLGPVTIIGDMAAVSQLANLTGMAASSTTTQYADSQILEHNMNGYIGKYNGCDVVALNNAYRPNSTTTILDTDWLYIVPGGMTGDARNLKVVNEGGINAVDAQNINDMVYEVRLDSWWTFPRHLAQQCA